MFGPTTNTTYALPALPPIDWSSYAQPPPSVSYTNATRLFGNANCTIQPPSDCGGHGHLGGKCFCICDQGYASDYSNLLSPRWCIPSANVSTAINRTVNLTAAADTENNE
ncbi:hypothetical protein Agub_g3792, partial [Astrephomene gubernaculifera]